MSWSAYNQGNLDSWVEYSKNISAFKNIFGAGFDFKTPKNGNPTIEPKAIYFFF